MSWRVIQRFRDDLPNQLDPEEAVLLMYELTSLLEEIKKKAPPTVEMNRQTRCPGKYWRTGVAGSIYQKATKRKKIVMACTSRRGANYLGPKIDGRQRRICNGCYKALCRDRSRK